MEITEQMKDIGEQAIYDHPHDNGEELAVIVYRAMGGGGEITKLMREVGADRIANNRWEIPDRDLAAGIYRAMRQESLRGPNEPPPELGVW
jgi:hypothetical protein